MVPRISPRFGGRLLRLRLPSGSSSSDSFLVFSSGFGSLRAREANEAGESTEAGEGSSGVLISRVSVSLTNIGCRKSLQVLEAKERGPQ